MTPPPLDALARVLTLNNIMTNIIMRGTCHHHITSLLCTGVPVLVEIVEFAVTQQNERIPFERGCAPDGGDAVEHSLRRTSVIAQRAFGLEGARQQLLRYSN